jgi:hypothetical protein
MGNDLSSESSETWKVKESIVKLGVPRLAIRSAPSVDASVEGVMSPGTFFTVYDKDGIWLKCDQGWVQRAFPDGEELCKFKHHNKSELERYNDQVDEKKAAQEKRDNEKIEVRCMDYTTHGGRCNNVTYYTQKRIDESGTDYHCGSH